MKILIITPTVFSYPLKAYGGIEYLVQELALGLVKRGHSVDMTAPKGSHLDGVNVIEVLEPSKKINNERFQFEVLKDMPLDGYDIIHDNTHNGWMYLHPDIDNLPFCWTLHNALHFRNYAPCKYMNIITISDNQKKILADNGFESKRVYNGINLNNYTYKEKKRKSLLYFSRFDIPKGAHIAINIAHKLKIPIDVAGTEFVPSPRYLAHFKRMCNKYSEVRYWGEVSNDMRKELFSNSRCLLFPLLHTEPFGIIVLEANASGTPVITRDRGPMKELITDKETGFICETDDEMMEAVKHIGDINPKACRENAERFSSDIMVDNYLDVYKSIIQGERW